MPLLLPAIPQGPMTDKDGNLRPEWRQYLTALDKIVRALNI